MPKRMTDQEWEAQNGGLSPAEATAQGLCWKRSGKTKLYAAFGGDQFAAPCDECNGTGRPR